MTTLLVLVPLLGGMTDVPSADPGAADVRLILGWLLAREGRDAFGRRFGDSTSLTGATDTLVYTDVAGVAVPKGLKAVPYDFLKARMQRIRNGARASPAVLIARSVADEPPDPEGVQTLKREGRAGGSLKDARYYYIEVAIGNLAWHWMKVAVGDEGGKRKAVILWEKTS